MPDARQLLNWLGLLLLVAIVIPFVIYAAPGVVGAEGSFVVLSGSMEPSISTGDVVIVDGVDPANVEERDVITYRRADAETPTTHRVVEINEQGSELAFVTKGDANDEPDASPVPASQVMGQVIFTIPYIGYVIEFVNTSAGFIALVVVPFVLLLLSEAYSVLGADGSSSNDEGGEPDRTTSTDPGPAQTASAPPAKAFVTSDPTATDPDGTDPGPSAQTPADGSTVAAGNGAAAAPEPAEESADTDESDAITVTRSDLRLSLGVLAGTAVYAGWVVYNVQTPWSFAVAFASVVGVALVGFMYHAAGSGDATEADERGGKGFEGAFRPAEVSGVDSEVRIDAVPNHSAGAEPENTNHAGSEVTDE